MWITCPHCRTNLFDAGAVPGQVSQCPQCGGSYQAPQQAPTPAPVPAPQPPTNSPPLHVKAPPPVRIQPPPQSQAPSTTTPQTPPSPVVRCPHCARNHLATGATPGGIGTCPSCGGAYRVPSTPTPTPTPAPSRATTPPKPAPPPVRQPTAEPPQITPSPSPSPAWTSPPPVRAPEPEQGIVEEIEEVQEVEGFEEIEAIEEVDDGPEPFGEERRPPRRKRRKKHRREKDSKGHSRSYSRSHWSDPEDRRVSPVSMVALIPIDARAQANLCIVPAFICSLIATLIAFSEGSESALITLSVIAVVFSLWGCCALAYAKGYPEGMGLIGILGLIGFAFLHFLPEQSG